MSAVKDRCGLGGAPGTLDTMTVSKYQTGQSIKEVKEKRACVEWEEKIETLVHVSNLHDGDLEYNSRTSGI